MFRNGSQYIVLLKSAYRTNDIAFDILHLSYTYSDGDLFSSQIDTVVILIGKPHPHGIVFVSRNRIEN